MKKITIIFALAIAAISAQSQQTSFEASEGYTPGALVDGINGWQETSDTSNYFYVSSENASEGENSLKMTYDASQPLIFADWNFTEALPVQDDLEISMDIYVPGGNTTLYWKVMSNDEYAAFIIIQEEYVFPAVVNVVNPVPIAMALINVGQFNEIKLKFNYTNETITYYANGVEIHQDTLWGSQEAIDEYSFEAFLFEDMYIDNLKSNNVLNTGKFKETPFSHFIQNNTLNLQSSISMEQVEIYNALGSIVLTENLNNIQESINLSALNSGLYIVRLKMNNQWHSFKIVK
ncbi:T9SS type A sorting domain-containing protein [Aequorivita xiaoshiensis]|uniref:T9SS type A sorting domain-containing protein n=1 Tax=Aequorivita xiaoshiensis TaxID=2874476 RepID=A0A9X1QZH1_9FLAO|nr:T9SS type A sorting domain-containing protein [Aequorivita xiaoshiensis]MCG2430415.1 T9SS type A sorting domain-containing protein [Aequorivita xiaoshiensis]